MIRYYHNHAQDPETNRLPIYLHGGKDLKAMKSFDTQLFLIAASQTEYCKNWPYLYAESFPVSVTQTPSTFWKRHPYLIKDVILILTHTNTQKIAFVVILLLKYILTWHLLKMQISCCCCLVAQPCPTLCNFMDCRRTGFSVTGFSRQEYWSGLLYPPFLL